MNEKFEALKVKLLEKKDVLIKVGIAVAAAAIGAGAVVLVNRLQSGSETIELEALPFDEEEEELEEETK